MSRSQLVLAIVDSFWDHGSAGVGLFAPIHAPSDEALPSWTCNRVGRSGRSRQIDYIFVRMGIGTVSDYKLRDIEGMGKTQRSSTSGSNAGGPTPRAKEGTSPPPTEALRGKSHHLEARR